MCILLMRPPRGVLFVQQGQASRAHAGGGYVVCQEIDVKYHSVNVCSGLHHKDPEPVD